ncbi:MAG: ATP-binding cassette domain-containing protein [Verrucomicrobiota bacterium]
MDRRAAGRRRCSTSCSAPTRSRKDRSISIDVGDFKDRFGSLIGYVPQEDLLHPELTVRQTLFYQAKLRLPNDVSSREIAQSIDRLCEQLGLYRPGGIDVRDVIVGSPERKGLSGGQRKRLSLAIELLTDPKVLFLDEPTSGLSSRDTRLVMEMLRTLASERNITVVITIHQPSLRVYRLLDKVIYLKSGKLGYFGEAYPDSISYFLPDESPDVAGRMGSWRSSTRSTTTSSRRPTDQARSIAATCSTATSGCRSPPAGAAPACCPEACASSDSSATCSRAISSAGSATGFPWPCYWCRRRWSPCSCASSSRTSRRRTC